MSDGGTGTGEVEGARRAREALEASGVEHRIVVATERASSLAEAARQRGIEPRDIVKSLVVRRGSGDYVFVLVPGDREISWPKARPPRRQPAVDAAGRQGARRDRYERGTITPFGSTTAWPVIADATVPGRTISMGAGAHGTSVTLAADDVVSALGADVVDVTDPA